MWRIKGNRLGSAWGAWPGRACHAGLGQLAEEGQSVPTTRPGLPWFAGSSSVWNRRREALSFLSESRPLIFSLDN